MKNGRSISTQWQQQGGVFEVVEGCLLSAMRKLD